MLVVTLAPLAEAAKDETILVSRQSAAAGGAGGAAFSDDPSTSADGRYIAFHSTADNLSAADTNSAYDIFVRDTATNATTLVSRQTAADGGAVGADSSLLPSISANGRYVAFRSDADNLSGVDENSVANVFVRDTVTNTTSLISRQSAGDGGDGGNNDSGSPSISADGRYIAFSSQASNFSVVDQAPYDVFVRDTQANTTRIVSSQSNADGGFGGDDDSTSPSISADGRYVAFSSQADNLSAADTSSTDDVFVRDRLTTTVSLVSRRSAIDGGIGGDSDSSIPAISANSRYVAFRSEADNLSGVDTNSVANVFVRDTATNTTSLVSRQSAGDGGAGGDQDSAFSSISADGRYVAFDSAADNLSGLDTSSVADVFVRDMQTRATTLVSRQSAADGGAGGDNDSTPASISADGRYIAFGSDADNLSALDSNGVRDVFVRDVLGPPASVLGPPVGAGADSTPPELDLEAKKKQKLGKPVKVKAACNEACSIVVKGTATPKGDARGQAKRAKTLKLKKARAELAAGETEKLKLKPSKKVARKLKRADKAKAKLVATATDAAGNSADDTLNVRLRYEATK